MSFRPIFRRLKFLKGQGSEGMSLRPIFFEPEIKKIRIPSLLMIMVIITIIITITIMIIQF